MTEHPVTLAVSDYVYNRAQQIAEATAQSIEQVLARQLEESFTQPLDNQTKQESHTHLSSEEDMIHIEPLSGPEIVERGLLGSWADMGIEDSVEWIEEQRRKRSEENRW